MKPTTRLFAVFIILVIVVLAFTLSMTALSQVLLAIIAIIGAWIALEQWAVAREKLNHDLFDRRFAVYVAVCDFMVAVLSRNEDLRPKALAYHRAIAPAPFLFDADIAGYVREVERRGLAATTPSEAAAEAMSVEEKLANFAMSHENLLWLSREFNNDECTNRFQPSLKLSRLKPFAVRELLSTDKRRQS